MLKSEAVSLVLDGRACDLSNALYTATTKMAFDTILCQSYSVYPLQLAHTMSKSKGRSRWLDWSDHLSSAVRRYEVGNTIYDSVVFDMF